MPNLPLLDLKVTRYALGFAFVLGLVLCNLPLARVLGPESALVLALALSPWAAAIGVHAMASGQGRPTSAVLRDAAIVSNLVLWVPVLLIALNALRVKACDPLGNLGFIALGPAAGLTLAAVLGAFCSLLMPRRWVACSVAVGLILAAIGRVLFAFYTTPAIFAYGHFFGYFPGTFFDRQIEIPEAWLAHRKLSGLIFVGLWAYQAAVRDPASGHIDFTRLRTSARAVSLVFATAALALLMAWGSHERGFATSERFIAARLGRSIETAHCRVVLPRELNLHLSHRMAEDCEFRIQQIASKLGVEENAQITAYFFRSTAEKRALMGAATVYIAKPWRREVYLQLSRFPHPVLPHELAHAVARHAASGPFGVPGRLSGLVPEPVLIEGTAVALEPVARDELTVHQWARAAQEADVAPKLGSLLGSGFFASNQALAYTLAGSFLRFVLEEFGDDALRDVYGTGDIEGALGRTFDELQAQWRRKLAQVPLSQHASDLARLRFERPSVFSQVCPHEVARLKGALSASLSAGNLPRATEQCREILTIDPAQSGTRATLVGTLASQGDFAAAQREIARLEGPPPAPSPTLTSARVRIADALYQRGDYAAAAEAYAQLLQRPQSEDALRQLDVKLLGIESGAPSREIIADLLVGGGGADGRVALHLIHALGATENTSLAAYLEGRQLLNSGRYDLALPLISQALGAGLPGARLTLEARRMAGRAAFALGKLDEAERFFQDLGSSEAASLADQALANDFLARISFRRQLLREGARQG